MAKNLRMTCKICDADLAFPSMHCDDCIKVHRVCRMCDASLIEKRDHAEVCGSNHRAAAAYQKAKTESVESVESVEKPPVKAPVIQPDNLAGIQEMLTIILARTEDLDAIKQAVKKLEKQPSRVVYEDRPVTPKPNSSNDDISNLIKDVELTEEEKAERGWQATQNFINSLIDMKSATYDPDTGKVIYEEKGPKKMEVPPISLPSPEDFDDIQF